MHRGRSPTNSSQFLDANVANKNGGGGIGMEEDRGSTTRNGGGPSGRLPQRTKYQTQLSSVTYRW